MKVAVLMSAYNGEEFINQQIDSIINQKGEFELHLFVRDDGSSDNTLNILKAYESKGKLSWYRGDNLGPAKSFIDLLYKIGDYDYYLFADQDDFWYPDKIQKAIDMISDEEPCIYFANALLVNRNLESLGRNVYKHKPNTSFESLCCIGGLLGCTMVFNSKMALIIKRHDVPASIIMHDFYISVICVALSGKILYDNRNVMKYRQHADNVVGVSNNRIEAIKRAIKYIFNNTNISIADQANSILDEYLDDLSESKIEWLRKIGNYKMNPINALRLALSHDIKGNSLGSSLKIRLAIALRNR